MPLYVLYFKAELEGISSLSFNLEEASWCLDVANANDNSDVRKGVTVDGQEELELEGSRGKANFVVKFEGSKKAAHVQIVKDSKKVVMPINGERGGEFVPICCFDCRGLEPIAWHPTEYCELTVVSECGAEFRRVDLSSLDWADYDEEGDVPVSVTEVEWELRLER